MESLFQLSKQLQDTGLTLKQSNQLAPEAQARAEASRKTENVKRFGDLIARAEGTLGGQAGNRDPYAIGFGYDTITDFSKHPGVGKKFKGTDGKSDVTTAAGKYQFIGDTYNRLAKKAGVKDFSPTSQDAVFREHLKEYGVLDAVERGDIITAADVLGKKKQYASLPSSTAKQNKRSPEEFARMAKESGFDISAAALGKQQALSENNVQEAFLPIYEQKKKADEAAQKTAQLQEQDMLAQEAAATQAADQEQQQLAMAQEKEAADFEKQAKLDSIGALLYEDTIAGVGKKSQVSTKYDKQLLDLIRAA